MSGNSDADKAWAWFDPANGSLRAVSFIPDHFMEDGVEQLEIDAGTAKDILLGRSRMHEYKVVTDDSGNSSLKYQPITITQFFSKFWTLEELPVDEIPWMGILEDARAHSSPIRVGVTNTGLSIRLVSLAQRGKVYVTRKNDPNYLVRTVDLAEAIKEHELGPIPVDIEDADQYSVYVRYYHAT